MSDAAENPTPESASLAWLDTERETGTVTRVEVDDGWFAVTSSNGWSCGVNMRYGVVPKVGDVFITWGSIGGPMRGQAINDRVLYYRTPAEDRAENLRKSDRAKAERIAEYEGKRSEFDARVAALPAMLRDRMEGFRVRGGDAWRWATEPYELVCCEEAARIVQHCPDVDAIRALHEMSHEERLISYPQMDGGHSGNTWGMSLRLARMMYEHEDLIAKEHAAICPLIGCKKAACWSMSAEANNG